MNSTSTSSARRRQRGASSRMLLGAIALLILLFAGGGAFYFVTTSAAASAPKKAAPPPAPHFVKVQPMTVNLGDTGRVLYVSMSLEVQDASTAKELEAHMPAIRNRVLLALSDETAEQLQNASGKRAVAQALRDALSKPYVGGGAQFAIEQVLLTDFIIQ